MQVSMVMMLALTGLGCQNKPPGASDAVPVTEYRWILQRYPVIKAAGT